MRRLVVLAVSISALAIGLANAKPTSSPHPRLEVTIHKQDGHLYCDDGHELDEGAPCVAGRVAINLIDYSRQVCDHNGRCGYRVRVNMGTPGTNNSGTGGVLSVTSAPGNIKLTGGTSGGGAGPRGEGGAAIVGHDPHCTDDAPVYDVDHKCCHARGMYCVILKAGAGGAGLSPYDAKRRADTHP